MILGIESVYGDKRLVGKTMSLDELKNAVKEILEKHEETNFASAFCSRFGYKEMPYNDGYAAYIVDLDTSMVFVTSYTFPKELDGAKVLYFTERGVFEPVYHLAVKWLIMLLILLFVSMIMTRHTIFSIAMKV